MRQLGQWLALAEEKGSMPPARRPSIVLTIEAPCDLQRTIVPFAVMIVT